MNSIKTCLYFEQIDKWPNNGKHILASYDQETVIVYQAYNHKIASEILKYKNFHNENCLKAGYNLSRMTWIKTNFLWMMYRSGWATKPNQERILAFRIKKEGFEEILKYSTASNSDVLSKKDKSVILQWDPDHNPDFSKVQTGRRAIQLGIRDEMLIKFSKEFIVDVFDITQFVNEQYSVIKSDYVNGLKSLLVPIHQGFLFALQATSFLFDFISAMHKNLAQKLQHKIYSSKNKKFIGCIKIKILYNFVKTNSKLYKTLQFSDHYLKNLTENCILKIELNTLNFEVVEYFYKPGNKLCWEAAKPGRSERGQNKAARPAAKNYVY
ncbi:hypothetical protein BpHYR1_013126 [Brachionus plicatilis]|uniref:Uncharacterized protein n=1 Tax=Brachionus plicatilis TaxID=10195 RepID=A0A3M7Q8F5_BRAPC|nr:hypothetical protein BpHYR1_013126 [Brachionus plicatilis]